MFWSPSRWKTPAAWQGASASPAFRHLTPARTSPAKSQAPRRTTPTRPGSSGDRDGNDAAADEHRRMRRTSLVTSDVNPHPDLRHDHTSGSPTRRLWTQPTRRAPPHAALPNLVEAGSPLGGTWTRKRVPTEPHEVALHEAATRGPGGHSAATHLNAARRFSPAGRRSGGVRRVTDEVASTAYNRRFARLGSSVRIRSSLSTSSSAVAIPTPSGACASTVPHGSMIMLRPKQVLAGS